jgi:hypothetical protein
MIEKRLICPERLRTVPGQFSWIDHTLVRKKYICGLSHASLALYLFLVTVSDAEGLSYYSDSSINRYLGFTGNALPLARRELCSKGLIAYSSPFYQVLSLQNSSGVLAPALCEKSIPDNLTRRANCDAVHIGKILAECIGGIQ